MIAGFYPATIAKDAAAGEYNSLTAAFIFGLPHIKHNEFWHEYSTIILMTIKPFIKR